MDMVQSGDTDYVATERGSRVSRKRQQQIKQVWFTPQDEERFRRLAEQYEREGLDVRPDNRKSIEEYSHTKVIRILMERAAS